MDTRQHRIRGSWPLYLVIGIAGAASIATSGPPYWELNYELAGPAVTLGPDLREETVPFTIRFSPEQDSSDIEVFGVVQYEGAAEELRLSLVDPGQRTLATQFHTLEGDGRLRFTLRSSSASLRCEPAGPDVCEQELALVLGTGDTRTGAYVIEWQLAVRTSGDGDVPPEDLVFEVDFPRGRVPDSVPGDGLPLVPMDPPAEGRWRMYATPHAGDLQRGQPTQLRRVILRGAGPYDASELIVPFSVSYEEYALDGAASVRIAIIPDQPGPGAAAEHVVAVSGSGFLTLALSVPEPLDCAGEPVCERGFTISVETDPDDIDAFYFELGVEALIEGEGDAPPDALIEIVPARLRALARQDG